MKLLTSDSIFNKICNIVDNASKSVKIASAWLKGNLLYELLDKLGNNVELFIILRASELQDLLITDNNVFRKIKEKNGKIYINNRLHAKFILVDDKEAILGSANFTNPGLSDYKEGNIEASVYFSEEAEVEKLVDYFEKIKNQDSTLLVNDICGFALSPVKTKSFDIVLIDPNIKEQSYIEVKTDTEMILAKISSIYSYNPGFFANPFSSSESSVFAPFEDFRKLFSEHNDSDWTRAATFAYLNEKGDSIRIAKAEIIGSFIEQNKNTSKMDTPMRPFDGGSPVYLASDETMQVLMKTNFSRSQMECPVKIGCLNDDKTDAFIDASEVNTKHMLVLGTTGSGKSYFTKLFLSRLVSLDKCKPQIFILDPHGEYYDPLVKDFGVPQRHIHRIQLPDTLFYIHPDEVADLIVELGFANIITGNSEIAKRNKSTINKFIKQFRTLNIYPEKNLRQLLSEIVTTSDKDEAEIKVNVDEEALNVYGKEEKIISNQVNVYKSLKEGLNSSKSIVIFDFSKITDPKTRVNLAGLIMQELFFKNRETKENRLLVLEEAHNFAPEGSYGDISSGKDNLALTMARKIASEGRKFNLGLLIVTQRPAQVSKYVLSQANTQAMFRTMNSADLVAIENYIEFAGKDLIELLPSLQTGIGVFSGLGVPFPVVVRVK
ncbi:helicase HerA domain-containing protein [Hippea sp. KM1]|uniref:helicase HerA domain-containing protein n=1 Tax=Hippea sp. KM1 TaxID=944481 RepID=UPI00046D0CB7|nr:DUF87 domain-containing protein [Hippea sp. KM1]